MASKEDTRIVRGSTWVHWEGRWPSPRNPFSSYYGCTFRCEEINLRVIRTAAGNKKDERIRDLRGNYWHNVLSWSVRDVAWFWRTVYHKSGKIGVRVLRMPQTERTP